jgi:hypothetical protein
MTTHGCSDALVSMNAALRRRCTAIQKLLAEAAANEIDTRYKIGAIVRSVMEDDGTYGERAVERIADVLGRDAVTLYRYAAVAKTWSEREMRDLSQRPNGHGEPLSWSHWVELARAPKTWRQWLELALLDSWPVRRLAREIGAELSEAAEALDSDAEDTTCGALLEVVKHAERFNVDMRALAALLDRLERSPRPPRDIEDLLGRAEDVVADVARKSVELLARVRELAPRKGQSSGPRDRRELEN